MISQIFIPLIFLSYSSSFQMSPLFAAALAAFFAARLAAFAFFFSAFFAAPAFFFIAFGPPPVLVFIGVGSSLFFFDFFTAMRFADRPFVFQDAESKNLGK